MFDCYTECELVSVEVNAATSGNRTIKLLNSSGNLIVQRDIYIQQGISRISLNINLPIQNNLRLTGPPNPNLWRNSNFVAYYPYSIPGILSIKYSSAQNNPTGYYYYFYNWEIKLPDCFSAKTPISVHVENCTYEEQTNHVKLSLYPNPANEYFNINTNKPIQALSVFDISGKNIPLTITANHNVYTVNISHINAGIYFVYLTIDNNTYVKKLLIHRKF